MRLTAYFTVIIIVLLLQLACSKFGPSFPPPPPDACLNVNINLNSTVTQPSVSGASDGSIVISATGSTGLTFSLNGSSFQSSNQFTNLAAGSYSIVAKNPDGCSNTITCVLINPIIPCTSITITVTANATNNVPCEASSATITAFASGGTAPYTYSLNGASYQTQNTFTNLASSNYVVIAKDANGCTGTVSATVGNQGIGPLFTQVRTLIRNVCFYCHNSTVTMGGINFTTDCSIVANKARIKARAVDGIPSPMPTGGLMPASERQKITDWINAGGTFSN